MIEATAELSRRLMPMAHGLSNSVHSIMVIFFFFKQKTAYEIGLGIPAEPLFRSANGRLHFHAVHFMRTLPTGSVDPNFGRRVRNRRQLNSLQNTWPYGYSMPIAVRYTQDAFSRSGWLWPVDAKGEPL